MEIFCIAHKKDVDGLGCHSIACRYAREKGLSIKHIFVDYNELEGEILRLDTSGSLIIFADLGYNESVAGTKEKLKELAGKNQIIWVDHHKWEEAGDLIELPIKFLLDQSRCASEILMKELLPQDEIAGAIAILAHNHDFRLEDPLAWKLYDIIVSGFDKPAFVGYLCQGDFWNRDFEDTYSRYEGIKERELERLMENSQTFDVNNFKVAVAFSSKKLGSTVAAMELLKKEVDFAVVVYPDGKLSFRRKNDNVDLRKIAGLFNGGGREIAAGGFLDKEVTGADYRDVFQEIVGMLREGI